MIEIITRTEAFTIQDKEYNITFSIEASIKLGRENHEIWGAKTSETSKEVDFELQELLEVEDESKNEIKITKDLEKQIRPLLHDWISENCDVLQNEVAE